MSDTSDICLGGEREQKTTEKHGVRCASNVLQFKGILYIFCLIVLTLIISKPHITNPHKVFVLC